jgi:FAD/FMN-containing dehydrogenase
MKETPMPRDRMEWVESWGMNKRSMAYVYRPSTVAGVQEAFEVARRHGRTVAFRGAGRSYGDAAMNGENVVVDLSRLRRILEWDPATGRIRVEGGATIQHLWEFAIEDGWWPKVVSGTMYPTIAGAAGMNIHGKNNFKVGTIGDQIEEFTLLLPNGELRVCSRSRNADLFHAAIGGFGMFGCMVDVTLKMQKVHSGLLDVFAFKVASIREMVDLLEAEEHDSDYMVGWVDCFPSGRSVGRGIVHTARYLAAGEDPNPRQSLRVANQMLPETLFGVLPKSVVWMALWPFCNDPGMAAINAARMLAAGLPVVSRPHYRQSHAAFAFLLDYVPNWKYAYLPGGLIQYQSFIPRDRAVQVFERQIRMMHEAGIVSYLGVFKKHRPDPFWMTHAVDGYSLALDFRVTESNRRALWSLCHAFDELVIANGGRLYFAKDSTMRPGTPLRYLPAQTVARFAELKAECDPEGLLATELSRRVFGDRLLPGRRLAAAAGA